MHPDINVLSLVTGSQRINEMRLQISHVTGLLFGFLGKEDFKGMKYQQRIFEFTTPDGFTWIVTHSKSSAGLHIVHSSRPDTWYFHSRELPLWTVIPIYRGLEQFVIEMLKAFPQLTERLQSLVEASKFQPIQ